MKLLINNLHFIYIYIYVCVCVCVCISINLLAYIIIHFVY